MGYFLALVAQVGEDSQKSTTLTNLLLQKLKNLHGYLVPGYFVMFVGPANSHTNFDLITCSRHSDSSLKIPETQLSLCTIDN